MASLTGGGLEIQTSIPNHKANSNNDVNIILNKFQFCKFRPYNTSRTRFNFSGTCLICNSMHFSVNDYPFNVQDVAIGTSILVGYKYIEDRDNDRYLIAMRIY